MDDTRLEKLKYPIGKFVAPQNYSADYIKAKIADIAHFPEQLKTAVLHLTPEQLETPYRQNGWTIRQLIHHCADSHMNCFIRIKWALTEQNPTIKFYHEDLWATLPDNRTMPIEPTLLLLEGLHFRLVYLMSNLSESDLDKSFIHPENNTEYKIKEIIGTYAWHGNHHLAHITTLKIEKGW